jgi:predicted membrane channel-forming protein YqfA (hemolysin III family)
MEKKIVLTYALRILGVILVLVYFFGHPLLNRLFPGFPVSSLNYFFYAGLLVYLVGAVLYYVFNRKILNRVVKGEEDEK